MRRTLALTLLVLASGCYDSVAAPADSTAAPRNDLRILGGAVECAGCSELDFTIGGPSLQWVTAASFVSSSDHRIALPARIELRRVTGDSGIVLQARAVFTGSLTIGAYDLTLLTPGRPGGEASMMLVEALHVTRVAPPTQPPAPPGTPGTPGPQPPSEPPTPPPPSGTLRVTVSSSGLDRDFDFLVYTGSCEYYYGYGCYVVSTVQPLEISLPATTYSFTLTDIAPNCHVTGPNPAAVIVVADSTRDLHFDVTCVAFGTVEVSVPVTGSDVPQYVYVDCAGGLCAYLAIQPPTPGVLRLTPGTYVLHVLPGSLPANCQAGGDVAVQVTSGSMTRISLPVTCQPLGEIRVSLSAPNPLHVYRVQYPDGCDDYDYYYPTCSTLPLSSGSPAIFRVFSGIYTLKLLDVPANCRVTSANPASVAVNYGVRSELAFDVVCQ
jgi:hypothetical protein